MFSALQASGLILKPTKLQFGQKEVEYLGHFFRKKAFQSVPTVSSILALREPECIKDNRGFLGTLNYVRRFIDGYAVTTTPLVELARKEFVKKTTFIRLLGPRNVKLLPERNAP